MRRPSGRTLKRLWLGAVMSYTFTRAGAVAIFLAEFGVSPWVYLVLDLAASYPFAIASARLVEELVGSQSNWLSPAVLTIVTYLIPDIYLIAALHDAPSHIYLITLAVVFTVSAATAAVIAWRVRRIHSVRV